MKPTDSERICLISYEVTRIRLGGGPDTRTSFWKVYREEQELNQKTKFRNEHVRICRPMLAPILPMLDQPFFYRKDKLVPEKTVG